MQSKTIKQTLVYLTAQAAAIAVLPAAEAAVFRLQEATVADINQAFEADALTSEQLVQLYLNRIGAYDQQGPAINSLINVNSNALERARELDRDRPGRPDQFALRNSHNS